MRIEQSIGEKIFNSINIVFMIFLIILTMYPMVHVAFASISKPSIFIMHEGPVFWPYGFSLESYKVVFHNPMVASGYLNTLFVVVVGVGNSILVTSLAAYVLSRKNVFWGNAIMFFIVFTMFFNGGLIPFYITVKSFHIDNTLWALILPNTINTFNFILMRTSFKAIPDSLEESAKLDGAGHFTIFFRIVLPLSSAVIAVMVLYYGVQYWNSWFYAMLFLSKRELYPLQLVLREILIQNTTSSMTMGADAGDVESIGETIKYAIVMVATLPILALYPFLQKYFVKGVMIGAVKG